MSGRNPMSRTMSDFVYHAMPLLYDTHIGDCPMQYRYNNGETRTIAVLLGAPYYDNV